MNSSTGVVHFTEWIRKNSNKGKMSFSQKWDSYKHAKRDLAPTQNECSNASDSHKQYFMTLNLYSSMSQWVVLIRYDERW